MSRRVFIAGAGAIARGTAALLEDRGHKTVIWSPSGESANDLSEGLSCKGALEVRCATVISNDPADIASCDVVLIALPGYAHKVVFDRIAAFLPDGLPIIVSSHVSFGALYLKQILAERSVNCPIICWGTTVVTGRSMPGSVTINTIRSKIDLCTVPEVSSSRGLALCEELFGDVFVPRAGLMAITLSNLNPQNHLGIAMGNMTRMERGEIWSQGQNITPNVGRFMEKLDAERLAIAEALGLRVRTIFEHFHYSFQVPITNISQMNQMMHAKGSGGHGPNTPDSRYVTEDVPYGLVPIALLGRLTERPAVLHQAGIDIFSAMYERDFMAENALLPALSIETMSLENLCSLAQDGVYTAKIHPNFKH